MRLRLEADREEPAPGQQDSDGKCREQRRERRDADENRHGDEADEKP